MLALQEFGMTDPSSNYSLCEVSVTDTQTIKQRRLPDQLQNLAERIGLSSRYYLKTNGVTETLVPDELAPELVRESAVHFLQLNAVEVAIQLTLQVKTNKHKSLIFNIDDSRFRTLVYFDKSNRLNI